jgi:tRNA(adenine34) deaminase
MQKAIGLAKLAYSAGEVPVGALIVLDNKIIGQGYNQTETLHDPTAHAEMLAITAATHYLNAKYLNACLLYVTLEPCLMCAAALGWAQIGTIVIGAPDQKKGFLTLQPQAIHPKTKVVQGVMEQECQDLVLSFFRTLRNS